MKTIPLTQGKVAIVDDCDYEYLNNFKWNASRKRDSQGEVRRWSRGSHSKRKVIIMSRVIMNPPGNMYVDHINHNPLDNRRSNLRLCTHTENSRNRQLDRRSTTGFKGVNLFKPNTRRPHVAQIRFNDKLIYLGCYQTAELAAQAYDKAAVRYFGEFAFTNKMMGLL